MTPLPPKKDPAANVAAKVGALLIRASGLQGAALLAAVDANLDRVVKAIRSPGPHAASAARIANVAVPRSASAALRSAVIATAARSLSRGKSVDEVTRAAMAQARGGK